MRSTRRPGPGGGPTTAGPRPPSAAATSAAGPVPVVPWSWSAALAVVMTGCYLLLAPHVSGDKDASEFVLALATGGVLHPTGYPVYTLLGSAYVALLHRLGAGFPFAANAWAAVGAGVALLLFHRLALRVVPARGRLSRGNRFLLAALPTLVLGFNPVWMVESTVVEVHSWHMAWACGTALHLAGLLEALEAGGARPARLPLRMAAWGFLCGLGGAHHTTAVFFAGAMTLVLCVALVRAGRFRAWVPLVWIAAGIVPLLSYGVIAYKALHPGTAEVWPMLEPGPRGLLAHVTASAYRAYLGHWAPDEVQAAWLRWYVHPYLWPGLALFAFQWRGARGARRRLATALLLAAAAQTAFAFRYGVPDPDAYFLPPLAVALLALVPLGAGLLARSRGTRSRAALVVAGAAALTLFAAPNAWMMAGRKQRLVVLDRYLHELWRSIPHERAIVLWPADNVARLREYQRLRHERPGLDVINTTNLLHDGPRARFRLRYGFDPLALVDGAHFAAPTKPEFVIGRQSPADAHGFALIHECIAERAGVPVVAFDPPLPPRTLPRAPLAPPRD